MMLKPTDLHLIANAEASETIRTLAVELAEVYGDLDDAMAKDGVPWQTVSRDENIQAWVEWARTAGKQTELAL